MTRTEKIKLLQQVATGTASIEDLDEFPGIAVLLYEQDGYYHCSGIPLSWGFPERLDRTQARALRERIEQYSQRQKNRGLPEPIILTCREPNPQNEPLEEL